MHSTSGALLLCCSTAATLCGTQQLPGAVRLAQVLSGSICRQLRHAAQAARQLEVQEPPTTAAVAAHTHPQVTGLTIRTTMPQQPQAAQADSGQVVDTHNVSSQAAAGAQQAAPQQQQQHVAVPVVVQPHQPPSPTGVKKTFYKRKLPCPPATEFSSVEGRLLFAEALQQGTMSGFFKLIEQYSTQDEPAFCGLASIAMVLNALSIDPKRPWKGSWRWFHEELLDCCLPLSKVAQEGVVLTQAACLAKCNGANVTLHRSGTFSLDEFRQAVVDTCTSGEEHMVVSYTRKAFGQTGDGHFSPIGGYNAARDLVLILDTARFKYPPHWVPLPMLHEAMGAVDPTTGQPRGYLRLSANARPDSVLLTLDIRPDGSWRQAEGFIQTTAPQLVQAAAAAGQATPDALLQQLVALAPLDSVPSFIAMRFAAQSCARDRCVPHTVRQQVLRELRATPLHQAIQPLLAQHLAHLAQQQQQQQHLAQLQQQQEHSSFLSEKLTVLLLLQEPSAWGPADLWADQQQHQAWKHLLDASAVSILDGEVGYLRQQLHHIEDVLQVSGSGSGGCNTCSSGASFGAAAAAGDGDGEVHEVHGCGSGGRAVVAAAAVSGEGAVLPVGDGSSSSPCSPCIFQDDCSLKGCMNVHGEVEVAAQGGTRMALQQQQQQQSVRQQQASAEFSSHGCCGSGHGEVSAHHGCCS